MQALNAVLDGSLLEGGGQILRNSIALSGLLGFNLKIEKIRGNRKRPGLQAQHLTCVKLVESITESQTRGAQLDSCILEFIPKKSKDTTSSKEKDRHPVQAEETEKQEYSHSVSNENMHPKGKGLRNSKLPQVFGSLNRTWEQTEQFDADIKTAGSVALLIQASLPCLIFSPSSSICNLKGGTNTMLSPQIEYVEQIFRPIMRNRFGIDFNLHVIRRGFYPKGGGEVRLETKPIEFLNPINITERGSLTRIRITAFVAGKVPFDVCKKMAQSARSVLLESFNPELFEQDQYYKYDLNNSYGDGGGILIVAETSTGCLIGGSSLLEKGVSADTVGSMAGKELSTNLEDGGCVDEFLQDQLIIYMALAKGESRILSGPISLHSETAIYVASNLTKAKFEIHKLNERQNLIVCQGIGYKRKEQE